MNDFERRRKMQEETPIAALDDRTLLRKLLVDVDRNGETLTDVEHEAFTDMLDRLMHHGQKRLSTDQRAWAERVYEKHVPQYKNLVSEGLVPRGREVATPKVLQSLPRKPPGRK